MENLDYKKEIMDTRVGCLGGSDGKLLAMVSTNDGVMKSAWKRLAVVKGLIPNVDTPKTTAMAFGDFVEQSLYDNLKSCDKGYESNPLWISPRYSKRNVKLIAHPDIVRYANDERVLYVYECKATKMSAEETKSAYRAQLFIEHSLAKEIADGLGENWRVRLFLAHYDTNGLDLDDDTSWDFDANRLTLVPVRFQRNSVFDIDRAMTLVDTFLDGFDSYFEGDEVDADLLPQKVREEFDAVTTFLREIKEREERVNAFKERLYKFMLDKDIKSVKNDYFSITRVDGTTSHSFDYKRFLEDYTAEHPTKGRKLKIKYDKVTNKKGFVSIKLKKD